jgi:anti-sigma regulatory factor (Ser/Thr protein kinase)
MKQPVKLTIPSDCQFLYLGRKVILYFLNFHEVNEDLAFKLVLCVDEACSNIIKYSYDGNTECPIEMSLYMEDNIFSVELRDYGKQCDATAIKPRPLDEIKPGGLGTHFMNAIMDDVEYCTKREQGTLLTMRKKLTTEDFSVTAKT